MQQAEATSGDPARPLMVDTWSKAPDRALDDPNLTPFDKVLLMKLIQVERRWGRDDGGIWESDSQLARLMSVRARSTIQKTLHTLDREGYIDRETDPDNPKLGRFIRFLWRPCRPGERADPCPPLRTPHARDDGQVPDDHCPPLRARTSSTTGAHVLDDGRERPPLRALAPAETVDVDRHYGLHPIRELLRLKTEEQQEARPSSIDALVGASPPAETTEGTQAPTRVLTPPADSPPPPAFALAVPPAPKPGRPERLERTADQIREDVVSALEWVTKNRQTFRDLDLLEADACKLGPDNPWTKSMMPTLDRARAARDCIDRWKKTRGSGTDANPNPTPGQGTHP